MTDSSAHMYHVGDGKPLRADDAYQSAWVSHWSRTSCKMESAASRCLAPQDARKDVVCNSTQEELLATIEGTRKPAKLEVFVGPTNISDISDVQRSSEDSLGTVYKVPSSSDRNATKTDGSEEKSIGDIPSMNSRSLINERSGVQSVSMFNLRSGSVLAPLEKVAVCDQHVNDSSSRGCTTADVHGPMFSPRSCRVASKAIKFPSRDRCSSLESVTENPAECAISYRALETKRFPGSTSFRYYHPGSSSNSVQYQFKSGETPAQSLVIRDKEAGSNCETASDRLTRLEQESCYCISPSTCSACDRGSHLLQKMPACSVHDAGTSKVCTTMDFGAGSASSTSNKDITLGQNPVDGRATLASPNVGCRMTQTEVPNCSEAAEHSTGKRDLITSITRSAEGEAAEQSTGKRDLITSITRSVEGEHSQPHVEQPRYKSSNSHQYVHDDNLSSRVDKRLKLSPLDSPAYDRKGSKNGDQSSSEKAKRLFTKVMNYSISSSEAITNKRPVKGQTDMSKSVVIFRNMGTTSNGAWKEHQDETISHPWIQRWCQNETTVPWTKRAANVNYETQVSNATKGKHFPSIAAMALMGKATNSFRPCEFKKRGPVIVWNTDSTLGMPEHSQSVNTN